MRKEKLADILKTTFGHKGFRFEQERIIHSILDGKDVLAIMPTGGGKSLCYQVPALYLDGITLIISPLISLMHDQVLNLKEYGVAACYLNSSLDYEQKEEIQKKILNKEVKIVYVSPEGILSPSLSHFFKNLDISLIAIDEAHCVSQWGHEFRKDYTRLGELKNIFPNTQMLALTATADQRTRQDISAQLRLNNPDTYICSFDRPNIKYNIYERENEISQLIEFIKKEHSGDTGIVYCLSRKKVERVTEDLNKNGFNAVSYHAGMSTKDREETQNLFNVKDNLIVVATIAFGMGIDRPDVRFVAHLDLPKSIEGYYQETGRAGRDGAASSAWMVYGLQDVIKLSQMLETTDASESYKRVARSKLDSMLSLCETPNCRRKYLLSYFEEVLDENCNNCDACLEPAEKIDASIDAKKVISTIYRTGQYYGAGHIIDVLRGSKNQKILDKKHDQLSVYAIGKDKSKNYWNSIIRQLLNSKFLDIKSWEYRNLVLSNKSHDILKDKKKFLVRKIKNEIKLKQKKKTVSFSHGRNDLFEALREIRKKIATENKIPPYIVFGDKALHDMCQILPRNKDEFLLVNGVGISKCEKYADDFLSEIQNHI